MKPRFRVFLSHATQDEKAASALRTALGDAGFEVWDPARQLMPGSNWALEVGRAMGQADAMVVLLSPAATSSPHVQRDIEYALGDVRFKGRLLPVVVKPVKDIPWILETLDVLRIASDPSRGSRRVVEALRRIQAAA
jgi:hypothetical protein